MRINIDITQGKVKPNLFFTSDFHLFHKNILKFDKRPFDNLEEMHNAILLNWNKVVGPDDIVIYLGDLSFARREEKTEVDAFLKELNGKIHYVLGNHDNFEDIKKMGRFETIQDYLEVRLRHFVTQGVGSQTLTTAETTFCCMHYPIYSWNKGHHGTYMIHGHCHGNLHHGEDASFYTNRRVIDVGCMLHNYEPLSYIDIIDKLQHVVLPKITRSIE